MRASPGFARSTRNALLMACLTMAATGNMPTARAQEQPAVALVPSAGFEASGKAVQDLVRSGDFAGARVLLASVQGKAASAEDHYLVGNFQLQIGRYFEDQTMQRRGLEAMLATGLTPAGEAARFHYYAGQFALNARDYAGARIHLGAAAASGFGGASTQVYLAEAYFAQAQAHRDGDGFDAAGRELVRQGLPHLRRAIALEEAGGRAVDPRWIARGLDMAQLSTDPNLSGWRALGAGGRPGRREKQLLAPGGAQAQAASNPENPSSGASEPR